MIGDASSALSQLIGETAMYCGAARETDSDPLDLAAEAVALRRMINRLELHFASLAGRMSSDADFENRFGLPLVPWLRDECAMTTHAAMTAVSVGRHAPELERSIAAVDSGRIGWAHLSWMANTASRLATSSSAGRPFDERTLLPKAERMSVNRFRRECERVVHAADHEAFAAQQALDAECRSLRLTVHDGGSLEVQAWLDPEGGSAFRAALEPLAQRSGADDDRPLDQRRGDALVELCVHAMDRGSLPASGGRRPHLQVTATVETLQDLVGAPAADLEQGPLVSGETVQRYACDGAVQRILLDSTSQPIDVGRTHRVVPPATRAALNVRDRGCVWPGCERSSSWTHAHHLVHWIEGGATELRNLVLLCHRHHWLVHEGGHAIARTDDSQILVFAPLYGQYPSGRDPALLTA